MNFQDFVPGAAQDYLTELINGTSNSPGLLSLVEQLDRLVELEAKGKSLPSDISEALRDILPQQAPTYEEMRNSHLARIATITRLGEEVRMKDAYGILITELTSKEQWFTFLRAAWSADRDFLELKDNVRQAQKLVKEIGLAAERLSNLLLEFQNIDIVNKPHEFYNIRHILSATDNPHTLNYNYHRWKSMRHIVVGEHYPMDDGLKEVQHYDESYPAYYLIEEYEKQITSETGAVEKKYGEREAAIHLAWSSAPQLPELLKSLSRATVDYSPSIEPTSSAAIASRKSIRKTQYIRAFAHILSESDLIPITTNIMKAMAITSIVVLNDPDIDVSYDDVRKAIA